MSSSSPTSSPVVSAGRRGRKRGGSRVARVGRARPGVRTRSRSVASTTGDRTTEGTTAVLDIVQSRKERMKTLIQDMPEARVREVLQELVEVHPSLVLDVLEPTPRQPGGYHPPGDGDSPDWCVCGNCRQMPTDMEKVCCALDSCLTLLPEFQVYILDEGVLALARLYRQDLLLLDEGVDIRKANRHAAYRQFVLWQHGRLGVGNRVVIPSCCVWKIRDKYPDAFGQYKGFIPNRMA